MKKQLATSPSDCHKCKKSGGFSRVKGHVWPALFNHCFTFVCIQMDLGCAAEWGRVVHLDALRMGFSDFELRIQLLFFC